MKIALHAVHHPMLSAVLPPSGSWPAGSLHQLQPRKGLVLSQRRRGEGPLVERPAGPMLWRQAQRLWRARG